MNPYYIRNRFYSPPPGLNGRHWLYGIDNSPETKVRVGDTVRVVSSGKCYSGYDKWVKRNNIGGWKNSSSCKNGEEGKVKVVAPFDKGSTTILAFVEAGSNSFIIQTEGLEVITKTKEKEKKMARRVFRLNKNILQYKKGLLVQEECDDGDQDYNADEVVGQKINDFIRYDYYDKEDYYVAKFPRGAVEGSKEWTEVFEMPASKYLTKEEAQAVKDALKSVGKTTKAKK